jgi:hypothetical protein
MGLIQEEDQKRFFNGLCLEAKDSYLHPVTGLLHQEGVIYLYDNFLAAHGLLRSKLKENIEEAKKFLERLLYFQNAEGLFPQALHEFPMASFEAYQLDIAFVMHKMHTHFALALGEKLKTRLQLALEALTKALKNNSSTYFEKMQARFGVFDALYQHKTPQFNYPGKKITSKYLGEKLLLAQETDSYEKLLEQLAPYWHPYFHTYTGPLLEESYVENEPTLQLFDYFMSSAYRTYSDKLYKKNILQLQGTLIKSPPTTLEFQETTLEGLYKDYPYTLINTSKVSWFFFNDYSSIGDEPKGLHLFRCLFKSLEHLYSFVCHSKVKHLNSEFSKNALTLDFTYFDVFPDEVKQQNELEFYMSLGEDLDVLVEGKKASLFRLGNALEFKTQEATLRCTFTSDSKDAQIVGHLLYGNRPSSLESNSVDAKAYDQKIVLRTLRRDKECKMRLHLELV